MAHTTSTTTGRTVNPSVYGADGLYHCIGHRPECTGHAKPNSVGRGCGCCEARKAAIAACLARIQGAERVLADPELDHHEVERWERVIDNNERRLNELGVE